MFHDEDTACWQTFPTPTQPATAWRLARSAARAEPPDRDPRLARGLPWDPDWLAERQTRVAEGTLLSVLLIGVPGLFFYRAATKRRWSLRWSLLAPAVVGLFLLGLSLPLSEAEPVSTLREFHGRFKLAGAGLPLAVTIFALGLGLHRRRWWVVAVWLAGTVGLTGLVGGIGLAGALANLGPGEYVYWDGWTTPFWVGGYAACWVTGVCYGLYALWAEMRRRWWVKIPPLPPA